MEKRLKYILIGIFAAIAIFFIFGIPTAIIPTKFYTRMIPANLLDLIFLVLISAMLGAYASLSFYSISKREKGNYLAGGSAITSIFVLNCPICISFLVAIFGTTALLTYFEPVRPWLGVVTVGMLGAALFFKIDGLKKGKCKAC